MTEFLFWTASFLVIYPYLIYPLLLVLLARLGLSKMEELKQATNPPRVTLVISAFNEAAVIGQKLENCMELDYPASHIEFIVASDASSDKTDEIVREYRSRDERVVLIRQEERRGKSAALNNAVHAAAGDIVVFSDANAMYEKDAIQKLVNGFTDSTVGYVVGAALYRDPNGNCAAENEGLYWKFELFLKRLESRVGSVVGGDGAIYAVRKHLFRELKEDDISDFVNPLQVVAAGYRGIFVGAARCHELAGETISKEFGRKRRIVNRSWRAVRRYGGQLGMKRNAKFVFLLASHKILRWIGMPLIAVAWLASFALISESFLYFVCWLGITISMLIATAGALLDCWGGAQPRLVSILYYFYIINVAGMLGIWDDLRGVRHVTWDHIRKKDS